MSRKLNRKSVIGVVINLRKKFASHFGHVTRKMTYDGCNFFAQNGEHLATIYQSCFLIIR